MELFLEISFLFTLSILLLSTLVAVGKILICPGLKFLTGKKNEKKCNIFGHLGIHSFIPANFVGALPPGGAMPALRTYHD